MNLARLISCSPASRAGVRSRCWRSLVAFSVLAAFFCAIGMDAGASPAPRVRGHAQSATSSPTFDAIDHPMAYGSARTFAAPASARLQVPMVAIAIAPHGSGYWLLASNGVVVACGAAPFEGSATGSQHLAHVVAIAATHDGRGYWVAAANGRVQSFGDASAYAPASSASAAASVTAMAPTSDGKGYWLVTRRGEVLPFGDAASYGSVTGQPLEGGVVDIAATSDGRGYWLVTSLGQVLAFGDANSYGSLPARDYTAPIVGIARSASSRGYLLAASNGGVFTFGAARFHGSAGATPIANPVVAFAALPSGSGYWLLPSIPRGLQAPGPGFLAGHVTAIGDSVMLDAAPDLQADIPGIDVEAQVGRQWDEGAALAAQLKAEGKLGAIVVVDLGTNGPVDVTQFQSMMQALQGASRVIFVTVHLPSSYSWSTSVNATLDAEVPKYANARLVDFNALADKNPSWFGADGVHMAIGGTGAQVMARLITAAVRS
jgi:hypothetical protein